MKKVRIKDIADIAGVSRGTVDRVINGRGNVSTEVEQKILKIAKDLGYEKNAIASALATSRTFKLAIVTPSPISDIFWLQPREGIMKALDMVKHYGLKASFFDFNLFNEQEFVMKLNEAIEWQPDAILVAPTYTKESLTFFDRAKVHNIPCITINTEIQHTDILAYIGQNSFQSGYLAGKLFDIQLNKGDEVVALNFGHNISNALHYSDKVDGLRKYFEDKKMFENNVSWYEFEQYSDEKMLLTFWESIKAKHPNLKGLFFTNSRAYRLLSIIDSQEIKHLNIVGFDLIAPNIELIKNGKLDFVINQNAKHQGYHGVMTFVNHFIHNKIVKRTHYLPLDIVIKENLDFYIEEEV